MSGYLKVGDYTKAGFWYLAFKKGYISFCRDVQLLNEEPVCQEDMNLAWVQTIEALHARWVEGDGARGSKMQHDKYLQMAKLQVCFRELSSFENLALFWRVSRQKVSKRRSIGRRLLRDIVILDYLTLVVISQVWICLPWLLRTTRTCENSTTMSTTMMPRWHRYTVQSTPLVLVEEQARSAM